MATLPILYPRRGNTCHYSEIEFPRTERTLESSSRGHRRTRAAPHDDLQMRHAVILYLHDMPSTFSLFHCDELSLVPSQFNEVATSEIEHSKNTAQNLKGRVFVITRGAQGIDATSGALLRSLGALIVFGDIMQSAGNKLETSLLRLRQSSPNSGTAHFVKLTPVPILTSQAGSRRRSAVTVALERSAKGGCGFSQFMTDWLDSSRSSCCMGDVSNLALGANCRNRC